MRTASASVCQSSSRRFLVVSLTTALGFLLGQQSETFAQPELGPGDPKRFYMTSYNLQLKNDVYNMIRLRVLYSIYSRNREYSSAEALTYASGVAKVWQDHYAPGKVHQNDVVAKQMWELSKTAVKAAPEFKPHDFMQLAEESFGLFRAEWNRFEASNWQNKGEILLREPPSSWGMNTSPSASPLIHRLMFSKARESAEAGKALDAVLKDVNNGAGLDAPLEDWEERNKPAAAAAATIDLSNKVDGIKNSIEQVRAEQRALLKQILKMQNAAPKEAPAKSDELTPEQKARILASIQQQYAPYLALNDMFRGLFPNDKTVQGMGVAVETALKITASGDAIAQGALAGLPAFVGLANPIFALASILPGLLGDQEQSLVLEQLAEIREALVVVKDQLNRIERALGELTDSVQQLREAMNLRFDALEVRLDYVHADLRELQLSGLYHLGLLDSKVDTLRNEVSQTTTRRRQDDLARLEPRLSQVVLTEVEFNEAMNDWLSLGTRVAEDEFGPLPSPGAGDDSNHAHLFGAADPVLNSATTDLWSRLNSLNLISRRLGNPLYEGKVVNPALWAECARSFLMLTQRHPDHYAKYDPERKNLRKLLLSGRRAQRAASNVLGDGSGQRSSAFVRLALSKYERQLDGINAVLAEEFERHSGPMSPTSGLDVFGTAEQDVPLSPPPSRLVSSGNFRTFGPMNMSDVRSKDFWGEFGPDAKYRPADPENFVVLPELSLDDKAIAKIAELVPKEAICAQRMKLGTISVEVIQAGLYEPHVTETSKLVFPTFNGEVPQPIRQAFPRSIGNSVYSRFAKPGVVVSLVLKTAGAQIEFRRIRIVLDKFYFVWWREGKKWTVQENENTADVVLANFVPSLAARFVERIGEGRFDDVTGEAQKIAKAAISIQVLAKLIEQQQKLLSSAQKAWQSPGGDLRDGLLAISGSRLAFTQLTCLGFGEWLDRSEDGKNFRALVKNLPTTADVTSAVTANMATFLNPKTAATAAAVLHQQAIDVGKALDKVDAQIRDAKTSSNADRWIGRHGILDDTIAQLELKVNELESSGPRLAFNESSASESKGDPSPQQKGGFGTLTIVGVAIVSFLLGAGAIWVWRTAPRRS